MSHTILTDVAKEIAKQHKSYVYSIKVNWSRRRSARSTGISVNCKQIGLLIVKATPISLHYKNSLYPNLTAHPWDMPENVYMHVVPVVCGSRVPMCHIL